VRLHFAELEDRAPGERVFDVSIGDKKVLSGFDVAREAGGPFRAVVREFAATPVDGQITIAFRAVRGEPCASGVEVTTQDAAAK
jgi:beta-galactosidase